MINTKSQPKPWSPERPGNREGDYEKFIEQFAKAGINVDALAAQLQDEGAKSFVKSWNELLAVIASKSAALKRAA